MAKRVSRKLKVFQARFGFHDSVVAAPSQAAALRAWGTHQNLFANGQARLTEDAKAAEIAQAHPGVPLKRAIGAEGSFSLAEGGLPVIPDIPRPPTRAPGSRRGRPQPRPPPDRGALDEAEAALRRLEADRQRQEDDIRSRQAELDAEREAVRARFLSEQKAAGAKLAAARAAYNRAGGKP